MQIAIISDVHANLEGLNAALNKIDSLKIKQIYCAGDIVGYCSNPNEVIEILRKREIKCIQGNHDWAIVNDQTAYFNHIAAEALVWTMDKLTKRNFAWLKKIPIGISEKVDGIRILLLHGSPRDPIWEYTTEEMVDEQFVRMFKEDVLAVGHSHIPFIKKVGKKIVLNPGAVGQPRIGSNKISFAVLDTQKFDVKLVYLDYDYKTAAKKIIKAGLPEFLAQRLYIGV